MSVCYNNFVTIRVFFLMIRRPPRVLNREYTDLIGIPELEVVDCDSGQYIAINADHSVPDCPRCGGKCINHKSRKRVFTDYVLDEKGREKMIFIRYDQYMYWCQNPECGHLFSKDIDFAAKNAKVTKRFEELIAKLALGKSYGDIKAKFGSDLARSTIKDILGRQTKKKESLQERLYTPTIMCVFPFRSNGMDYVVFADGADEDRYIIEVLTNPTEGKIMETLSRFNMEIVEEIVIDTSPKLRGLLFDNFPSIEVQVHPKALLRSARIDLSAIVNEDGRYIRNEVKRSILKSPEELQYLEGSGEDVKKYNDELAKEIGRIKKETDERPRIGAAYEYYLNLHRALLPSADYAQVEKWNEAVQMASKELDENGRTLGLLHNDDFGLTLDYIRDYKNELMTFYLRRTEVTQEIYEQLSELNDLLDRFNTYSDESLRYKILYLAKPLIEKVGELEYWHGVPIQEVMKEIKKL